MSRPTTKNATRIPDLNYARARSMSANKHATSSKSHFGWESPNTNDQDKGYNCQLCGLPPADRPDVGICRNYQHHYSELEAQSKQEESPQSSSGVANNSVGMKQDEEAFWYPSSSSPPPPHYHPGMIKLLQWALKQLQAKGHISCAALCYEQAVYIPRETWDASWGCGSVLSLLRLSLSHRFMPSVHLDIGTS
ncbi:hypothetical protein BDN71DRAFT_572292 [Pleurotus eryngii]|uniref:Uncharacterized protein n=1 Tax=Pleurotus eryngii TaxID=5323 RepID=A0A9P5ZHL0_PLEER|nr:hypothetical protein BDN71DRAFT_572292 [Pleurotus eryngii]